jgi:rhodanese-related sulfurtransferase
MSTTTLNKEQQLAVEHFERKLAFEIGPHEVAKPSEKFQIIDLRDPESFAKGHVPGSVNVSFENLEKYADKLSPNMTTVVYCYNITCHLATKAALLLAKKGYKVRELVGGIEEYSRQELTLEQKAKGGSCGCG